MDFKLCIYTGRSSRWCRCADNRDQSSAWRSPCTCKRHDALNPQQLVSFVLCRHSSCRFLQADEVRSTTADIALYQKPRSRQKPRLANGRFHVLTLLPGTICSHASLLYQRLHIVTKRFKRIFHTCFSCYIVMHAGKTYCKAGNINLRSFRFVG